MCADMAKTSPLQNMTAFGHKVFPLVSSFKYAVFLSFCHLFFASCFLADDVTPTESEYIAQVDRFCNKLYDPSFVHHSLEYISFCRRDSPYDV